MIKKNLIDFIWGKYDDLFLCEQTLQAVSYVAYSAWALHHLSTKNSVIIKYNCKPTIIRGYFISRFFCDKLACSE
jgi:hypothetical protein